MRQDNKGPLVEPAMIPDIFVSGVGRIELLEAGMVRWTYYTSQHPIDRPNSLERVVVARIVMPMEVIPGGMERLASAFGTVMIGHNTLGASVLRH